MSVSCLPCLNGWRCCQVTPGSIPSLLMNVALGRFEVSKCFPFCRWEDDLVLPGRLMISVSIDHVQYLNQEASLGQLFRMFFVEHGVLFDCTHSVLDSYQGLKKNKNEYLFVCSPSFRFADFLMLGHLCCFSVFYFLSSSCFSNFSVPPLHSDSPKGPAAAGRQWGWNPIVGVST